MINFSKSRTAALKNADFESRYGWGDPNGEDVGQVRHTQAEVEAIWDEVVALIPAGVTKILEVGCGGGGLFHKIRAAFPDVDYLGIDIVPENIEAAQASLVGEPASLFEISTAADTLMRSDPDWDFVVSVNCLCASASDIYAEAYLGRVNVTSSKGFVVVGAKKQLLTGWAKRVLSEIEAESSSVSGSYVEGDRGFLDDALLKNLHPIYITREDAGVPSRHHLLPAHLCVLAQGDFNKALMRTRFQDEVGRLKNPEPTEFTGVTVTRGRVTAREVLPVEEAKVRSLK